MPEEFMMEGDFDEKWQEFTRNVETGLGYLLTEIGTAVRQDIAEATPIRTGRASASWNATLNAPDLEGQPRGYDNPAGAPSEGKVELDGATLDDVVYIANGLPYVGELDEGSSKQAPAGFVEAITISVPNVIDKYVEEARAKL